MKTRITVALASALLLLTLTGCDLVDDDPKVDQKTQESNGECGGFRGSGCGADDFCRYPSGTCGIADRLGRCEPVPDACIELWAPVCGCDGATYSNACHAAIAGVSVDHEGECD